MVVVSPQVGKRRDAEGADPARHDAAEVPEIGVEVDRDAVIGDPAPDPHPERADLGLLAARLDHPDADPAGATLALDTEAAEGADQPLLQPPDIGAQIRAAAL